MVLLIINAFDCIFGYDKTTIGRLLWSMDQTLYYSYSICWHWLMHCHWLLIINAFDCILGVPTTFVQTRVDKQRWSRVNIFARMDLQQTISGGSTMVNPIV